MVKYVLLKLKRLRSREGERVLALEKPFYCQTGKARDLCTVHGGPEIWKVAWLVT